MKVSSSVILIFLILFLGEQTTSNQGVLKDEFKNLCDESISYIHITNDKTGMRIYYENEAINVTGQLIKTRMCDSSGRFLRSKNKLNANPCRTYLFSTDI